MRRYAVHILNPHSRLGSFEGGLGPIDESHNNMCRCIDCPCGCCRPTIVVSPVRSTVDCASSLILDLFGLFEWV